MDRSGKQPRLSSTAAAAASAPNPEFVLSVNGVDVHRMDQLKDWARLPTKLVSRVADDLLLSDVTEYIRLRAVCKPWRGATADPSLLQPRFFPRNWLMLGDIDDDDREPRHFVNVLTGASLHIHLPTPYEFSHHCYAEGLMVLHHTLTDTVCLLNPLTQECTDLPTAAMMPDTIRFKVDHITAAGIVVDEATQSKPTVVLSVRKEQHTALFHAKPGDKAWGTVDLSCIEDYEGEIPAFIGGLSVRGRFYVATRSGDVLAVELRPQPHLAYVARQDASLYTCGIFRVCSYSFLVPSIDDKDDGMLMVRTTADGETCLLFVVDVANRRLTFLRLRNIGDRAVFLPCVTLRSRVFPSMEGGVYGVEELRKLLYGNDCDPLERDA